MKLAEPKRISYLLDKSKINATLKGLKDFDIQGINDVYNCSAFDMVFIDNERIIRNIAPNSYLLIITTPEIYKNIYSMFKQSCFVLCDDPFNVFCKLIDLIAKYQKKDENNKNNTIPSSCNISNKTHVNEYCNFGKNVILHPFVYVGNNVRIGNDTVVYPSVTIGDNTIIGDNVVIDSGSSIGSQGFYYSLARKKIPMIGNVLIEDDVEIGSNTSIDKSAFNSTIIGRGTKIDNNVHIAHDVKIGSNCLIMAHAAISGQVVIGNNVTIRGMSGIVDMISVADYTDILPMSGVTKATRPHRQYIGMPAQEMSVYARKKSDVSLATYYKQVLDKHLSSKKAKATENMRTIFNLIKHTSGIDLISQKDELLGAILDSLDLLELIISLEEHFKIEIDSTDLNRFRTIKDLMVEVNNRLLDPTLI